MGTGEFVFLKLANFGCGGGDAFLMLGWLKHPDLRKFGAERLKAGGVPER